ncbi:hypothetical protein V6N12_022215 [Hibiscus sabdariffa]|uniref:Uncharacterized protein n=1 Tax=Hibiscus sabdariffa TaxID=183260 RepID=A0ABR2FTZ4_9ROSI
MKLRYTRLNPISLLQKLASLGFKLPPSQPLWPAQSFSATLVKDSAAKLVNRRFKILYVKFCHEQHPPTSELHAYLDSKSHNMVTCHSPLPSKRFQPWLIELNPVSLLNPSKFKFSSLGKLLVKNELCTLLYHRKDFSHSQ